MITIEGLTKDYGRIRAVDALDLAIPKGEFFGFLGPNGAGKTTTIRILTTLTRPSRGRITVGGFDLIRQPRQAKLLIGLAAQNYNLDRELTGRESLHFHGRLWGLKRRARIRRAEELLDLVGLLKAADKQVREYSGGMKRRLMIARALMHRPEILFLDEPTVGLDVEGRRQLWGLLKGINAQGRTIFLTTHYIEEAEELCQRVGVIHAGRLIALDSPAALIAAAGRVVVDVFEAGRMNSHFFEDRVQAGRFATSLEAAATIRPANLEDAFVKLTGRKVIE